MKDMVNNIRGSRSVTGLDVNQNLIREHSVWGARWKLFVSTEEMPAPLDPLPSVQPVPFSADHSPIIELMGGDNLMYMSM